MYGLGADATSAPAVAAIYEAKGRPADNPVIVHVARLEDVEAIGRLETDGALRLLGSCWPGPLTVVVRAREPVRSAVCRGLETVAVRMPSHPVALALIRAAGRPVAAPSANLSGKPSPTTAEHVLEDLGGRIPLILDGGPCPIGIESTVLDLSGGAAVILRPGAVGAARIGAELGRDVETGGARLERSPGTRYRHYRPRAPLIAIGPDVPAADVSRLLDGLRRRLRAREIGYVATRSARRPRPGLLVVDRRVPGSLTRSFYGDVRRLDRRGVALIFVEAVAADAPVMDRLRRAACCVLDRRDFDDPELTTRVLASADSAGD